MFLPISCGFFSRMTVPAFSCLSSSEICFGAGGSAPPPVRTSPRSSPVQLLPDSSLISPRHRLPLDVLKSERNLEQCRIERHCFKLRHLGFVDRRISPDTSRRNRFARGSSHFFHGESRLSCANVHKFRPLHHHFFATNNRANRHEAAAASRRLGIARNPPININVPSVPDGLLRLRVRSF